MGGSENLPTKGSVVEKWPAGLVFLAVLSVVVVLLMLQGCRRAADGPSPRTQTQQLQRNEGGYREGG